MHEPKLDGYRCQVVTDGHGVRLYSKTGTEWTKRLPALGAILAKLPARQAILDCELCYVDHTGLPDFYTLMGQMRRAQPDEERMAIYAFDLMWLDGVDLRKHPLRERRRRLERLLHQVKLPNIFLVAQMEDGAELMGWCERTGMEGVVSKRVESPYASGNSRYWLKTKRAGWRVENRERFKIFELPPNRDPKKGRR